MLRTASSNQLVVFATDIYFVLDFCNKSDIVLNTSTIDIMHDANNALCSGGLMLRDNIKVNAYLYDNRILRTVDECLLLTIDDLTSMNLEKFFYIG